MRNTWNIYFHWKKSFLLILIFSLTASYSFAQNKSDYHVIKTFHVGGQGWWDYIAVNSNLKRIYVSHGTEVNILDETTGDSIGIIPNTDGVHGIAFASPFEKGYTSNGRSNTVSVFNSKTTKY